MKKIFIKFFACILTLGMIAGCRPQENNIQGNNQSSVVSGTVSLNGSTSMKKLSEAMTEGFNEKHPKITSEVQFTGSGAGLEALASGTTDIGNSSRGLKDEEKANGLIENIVAIDGIAVIVDRANNVSDLTLEQLAKIYVGEITNWKDVGGENSKIVVVGRESGSGTRSAFEEIITIQDKCSYSQELDQTGAVLATVASTPHSIGYISLDVINDTIKTLKLNGAEPTAENIKAGSYELSRPFVMATKGAISEQKDTVKLFFDYVESAEGQEIIKRVGLISTK